MHHRLPTFGDPVAAMHHLTFAVLAFFMIQQQLVGPSPALSSGPWVAQALHHHPRTPPPTLEPEQIQPEDVESMDNS